MEYIEALQDAIKKTHGCESEHVESVPITETYKGQTIWSGAVEVFKVRHPKATLCYAWGHHEKDNKSRYITILNIPPVDTPLKAVRAAIIAN